MSLLTLVLATILAQEKAPEDRLPSPDWYSWADFAAGSSVTMEIEIDGKKVKKTTVVREKDAARMKFEEVVEANGARQAAREQVVTKPRGNPGVYDSLPEGECPACKKPRKDHKQPVSTESEQKMKVGPAEVDCHVSELSTFDCEGKLREWTRWTNSRDVPGHLVRHEYKSKKLEYKIVCVGFEKK